MDREDKHLDITKKLKKLVEEAGDPVHLDTPWCKRWRETHPNCKGCESELGCAKLTRLMQLVALSSLCPVEREVIEELKSKILKARTIEELNKIVDEEDLFNPLI